MCLREFLNTNLTNATLEVTAAKAPSVALMSGIQLATECDGAADRQGTMTATTQLAQDLERAPLLPPPNYARHQARPRSDSKRQARLPGTDLDGS